MKIIVFGSTGTAGSGAVEACLAAPEVTEVRAVTRRPLERTHEKLVAVLCSDFADLTDIAEHLSGVEVCLFCLGTSARNVSGEDQYREIHVTYALAAARALLAESPEASFMYLSGAGANRASRMMWARVKAEAEDQLPQLGLARCVCFRPGYIQPMDPSGAARWFGVPLLKVAPLLGVRADELGEGMLRIGLDARVGGEAPILENRDIRRILDR